MNTVTRKLFIMASYYLHIIRIIMNKIDSRECSQIKVYFLLIEALTIIKKSIELIEMSNSFKYNQSSTGNF